MPACRERSLAASDPADTPGWPRAAVPAPPVPDGGLKDVSVPDNSAPDADAGPKDAAKDNDAAMITCTPTTAGWDGGIVTITSDAGLESGGCVLPANITASTTLSAKDCPVYDAPLGLVAGRRRAILAVESALGRHYCYLEWRRLHKITDRIQLDDGELVSSESKGDRLIEWRSICLSQLFPVSP